MNMRPVALFVAVLLIAGCEKPVPPVYEEPIPLPLSAGDDSIGPRITVGAAGEILLSWMERRDEGGVLRAAQLGANGWMHIIDVAEDPAMFINWADLPSVTALSDGRWFAHWLSYSADLTYSYDVLVAQSKDAGKSWSAPLSPHNDGTPTEHGFVSVWPNAGSAGLVWLDGRKAVNDIADDPRATGMTLRAATIDAEGGLSGEQLVDDFVCDCCQTDIAVTASGPIVVYRNRTLKEIRDISISHYVDGSWQPGEEFSNDGWEIEACPVNGPAIAANEKFVAVAWFTAAKDSPLIKMRISKDGGKTFGEPILIASAKVKGHVDVTYVGDSSFAVSWVQHEEDLDDIRVRSVTTTGELGRIKTVGRTAAARSVPQMVWSDGKLIFAWTDKVGDATRIVSNSVEIAYAY